MEISKLTQTGLLGLFTLAVCECGGETNEHIDNHYYGYGGEVIEHTPAPVRLTTIDIPEDVDDDVVVGTVNPALIDLANGLKDADGRLDANAISIDNLQTFSTTISIQANESTERAALYKSYDIGAVTNEANVDSIAPVDVKGTCFRVGRSGASGAVLVNFRVPYEPNSSGDKSFDLALLADADWIPSANFASEFSAYGHGTANSGDVRSAVQIYAVPSTKTVRVSWDDAVSSTVAGTSFVRGMFSYPFTLP